MLYLTYLNGLVAFVAMFVTIVCLAKRKMGVSFSALCVNFVFFSFLSGYHMVAMTSQENVVTIGIFLKPHSLVHLEGSMAGVIIGLLYVFSRWVVMEMRVVRPLRRYRVASWKIIARETAWHSKQRFIARKYGYR